MIDLTGKWFHTFENGEIDLQGMIVGKVSDQQYLCQLFSWLTGYPTTQIFKNVSDMSEWQFFDSGENMMLAADMADKVRERRETLQAHSNKIAPQ